MQPQVCFFRLWEKNKYKENYKHSKVFARQNIEFGTENIFNSSLGSKALKLFPVVLDESFISADKLSFKKKNNPKETSGWCLSIVGLVQ